LRSFGRFPQTTSGGPSYSSSNDVVDASGFGVMKDNELTARPDPGPYAPRKRTVGPPKAIHGSIEERTVGVPKIVAIKEPVTVRQPQKAVLILYPLPLLTILVEDFVASIALVFEPHDRARNRIAIDDCGTHPHLVHVLMRVLDLVGRRSRCSDGDEQGGEDGKHPRWEKCSTHKDIPSAEGGSRIEF